MIYGSNAAFGLHIAQDSVEIETALGYAIVDKSGYAEDVEVSPEGCHFATRDEQEPVEIRLQFSHLVVVRIGIVIGDGDEVQPACSGGLGG